MVRTFGEPFHGASGLTHLFPTPEVIAKAKLAIIGLTRARAETIQALANKVCDGQIRFEGIVDSAHFLTRLCEIPGVGKWTAQYVAMRALGEPDAFPCGDLGLLHTLKLESSRELEQRAEAWRPWRAYAAMYLWSISSKYKARGTEPLSSMAPKTSLRITASRQRVSAAV
jgi:AraC family transcriptional regulator, regulatory protein of adaptative response / DNA-3-methyladenine glycosylase II